MCGFSVIVSNSPDKIQAVQKMNRLLSHRGPDNEGFYHNDRIAIGHQRLAIIDLSSDSNQPITDASGDLVLVFNGMIYNYQSLKKELDYSFKSKGDAEVLLALYSKFGSDFIDKLDGIFSFCLYDKNKDSLLIARDRMGQKPLYYYQGEGFLLICSELRPLLKTGFFKPDIDENSLLEYIQYKTVYSPNTIIDGVKCIPAASYVHVDLGTIFKPKSGDKKQLKAQKYWQVDNSNELKWELNQHESAIKLKELFLNAVEKRFLADVNVGVFLSGGVDSTAIVGAAHYMGHKNVSTFSIDFIEPGYSEQHYASLVSNHFKTDHHTLQVDSSYFHDHLFSGLEAMDHPSEDGLNTFFISHFAKKEGVSVALSGIGGDELFAGYYVFDILNKLNSTKGLWKLPDLIKKILISYRNQFKPGLITEILNESLLNKEFSLGQIYPLFRRSFTQNDLSTINKYFIQSAYSKDHFISSIAINELSYYMQNVLLRDADAMSMAASIELRAPFLDTELLSFALLMPDNIKGYNKQILKESLADFIPTEIAKRPKKGFVLPLNKWISEGKRDWFADQIDKLFQREGLKSYRYLSRPILSSEFSENIIKDFWHLVVLEQWLSINLDSV